MQVTPQIAVTVLLLLPGLLGHAVFNAFTYTEKPTWSGRTVVAVVLSGAAYISLSLLRLVPALGWLPDPVLLLAAADRGMVETLSPQNLACVSVACGLSFLYSLGLVWTHNHRSLHRLAALVQLTTKSGYISEWDSVMIGHARKRWVLVKLRDGCSFVGWLQSHDVSSSARCLVLRKVRQQDPDDSGIIWPENDLLVLHNMADVRYLRLIPRAEVPREQTRARHARKEVSEPQPPSAAAGAAARGTDAAVGRPGEAENVAAT